MQRQRTAMRVCLLLALAASAAVSAAGQTPETVRAVNRVPVLSRPSADAPLVMTIDPNTVLNVVDSDGQWFWVSLPPDSANGPRRGWVQAGDVEVGAAQSGPSSTSDSIPPSGDDLRRALADRDREAREDAAAQERIERARQNLERQRQAYDELVHRGPSAESNSVTVPPAAVKSLQPSRSTFEVFGGYSLLFDQSDSLTLPLGWIASVGGRIAERVLIVGEVSGAYTRASVLGAPLASANVHTFTLGPRFASRSDGFVLYGEILGGFEVSNGSVLGVSASSTGLALVPGFGIDVPLLRSAGVRFGTEFPVVRDGGGWFTGFRLTTGLLIKSGSR